MHVYANCIESHGSSWHAYMRGHICEVKYLHWCMAGSSTAANKDPLKVAAGEPRVVRMHVYCIESMAVLGMSLRQD